jgi:threonine aldolase
MECLISVVGVARENGLALHMDGARLWHAAVATGISERTFAEAFDTVSVCFSKGLGAPVGSALAGSRELITRARRFKQLFGGGMRQAGIVAAGGLHAIERHRGLLAQDVARARRFADALGRLDGAVVDAAHVQSNIVLFQVTHMSAGAFVDGCHERGVHMLPSGYHTVRAVLHLGVSDDDLDTALEVVEAVLAAS